MIDRLLKRLIQDGTKSILLLGPRQVGKSTLIQSLKPDLSLNLNDEKTFLEFKSNPDTIHEKIAQFKPQTVFIDEIQKHTALLDTIQTILDSQKKIKFYISGSSARKLKRGRANLLPGRIFSYEIGPLCSAELDYNLDISKAMSFGCLPEAYLSDDTTFTEKLLTTYSGTYLKEEIQAEALTRNLDGFSRFIMAAATQSGHILDYSKISKTAKIQRRSCTQFFEIMEDTLIAKRIEVFNKTNADIVKRPKYYFFDTGVLNGLLGNFIASNDRKGNLFEHLVINQILSSAKARDIPITVSYFRTRSGYEVDFILEIKNKVFAIEVKSGITDKGDAHNLLKFKDAYKKCDGFFIVTAENKKHSLLGVSVCGLSEFLKEIGL